MRRVWLRRVDDFMTHYTGVAARCGKVQPGCRHQNWRCARDATGLARRRRRSHYRGHGRPSALARAVPAGAFNTIAAVAAAAAAAA